jgi:hypothetical protein
VAIAGALEGLAHVKHPMPILVVSIMVDFEIFSALLFGSASLADPGPVDWTWEGLGEQGWG